MQPSAAHASVTTPPSKQAPKQGPPEGEVDGEADGFPDGALEGSIEGEELGPPDGLPEGDKLGPLEGPLDGAIDGIDKSGRNSYFQLSDPSGALVHVAYVHASEHVVLTKSFWSF